MRLTKLTLGPHMDIGLEHRVYLNLAACAKLFQHISIGYGQGFVSFAHFLPYFITCLPTGEGVSCQTDLALSIGTQL